MTMNDEYNMYGQIHVCTEKKPTLNLTFIVFTISCKTYNHRWNYFRITTALCHITAVLAQKKTNTGNQKGLERLFNSFIPPKNFYTPPKKQISGYAPDTIQTYRNQKLKKKNEIWWEETRCVCRCGWMQRVAADLSSVGQLYKLTRRLQLHL